LFDACVVIVGRYVRGVETAWDYLPDVSRRAEKGDHGRILAEAWDGSLGRSLATWP
jgi:hypothetical protein